jgi:hypothetical protein
MMQGRASSAQVHETTPGQRPDVVASQKFTQGSTGIRHQQGVITQNQRETLSLYWARPTWIIITADAQAAADAVPRLYQSCIGQRLMIAAAERTARFGLSASLSSSALVMGLVRLPRASQAAMAARSYVKPSAAITGTSISSCVAAAQGQRTYLVHA